MALSDTGCDGVDWIYLEQSKQAVFNYLVPVPVIMLFVVCYCPSRVDGRMDV